MHASSATTLVVLCSNMDFHHWLLCSIVDQCGIHRLWSYKGGSLLYIYLFTLQIKKIPSVIVDTNVWQNGGNTLQVYEIFHSQNRYKLQFPFELHCKSFISVLNICCSPWWFQSSLVVQMYIDSSYWEDWVDPKSTLGVIVVAHLEIGEVTRRATCWMMGLFIAI